MAIEKMSFAHISGSSDLLDDVLLRTLSTGLFQPEHAGKLSEYSVGDSPLLINPYTDLLGSVSELAARMRLSLPENPEAPDNPGSGWDGGVSGAWQLLDTIQAQLSDLDDKRQRSLERAGMCGAILEASAHSANDSFWTEGGLGSGAQKIRLGRISGSAPLEMLRECQDASFALNVLHEEKGVYWCVYFTSGDESGEVDKLFSSVGFEQVELGVEFPKTPVDVYGYIQNILRLQKKESEDAAAAFADSISQHHDGLRSLHAEAYALSNAFELRKYIVIFRGRFHMIGYLPTWAESRFESCFEQFGEQLELRISAVTEDIPNLHTPVLLKNNRFTRPFEMFVEMYGIPSYGDIDPTPFVAWTYCILFGIMFGDLGQGICISILGAILSRWKKMPLGRVMTRIGISSAVFGVAYGSVFGFEHLLDWFYVGILGLHEKPIEVFRPATTNMIMLAAVGIGAVAVMMVMIFNICVGVRRRDPSRILLSSNGLPGVVLFGGAAAAAFFQLVLGVNLLNTPYILLIIALPLTVMFFREPIERLMSMSSRETLLHKSRSLAETIRFNRLESDVPALFNAQYICARFGRLPTDSYLKLAFYSDDPFMLHLIKSDSRYIWCVYAMAVSDREQVDAIFADLFFERYDIPSELLDNSYAAEGYIRRCIDGALDESSEPENEGKPVKRGFLAPLFPEGFLGFFLESFFEMFEVLLSFVTNTMSFLRVGGFILSHAGMMSVVMALSEMAGAGASPVVLVIGNLFVMGLEGLIVGIQVLRLEFYEMFSRFFDAGGEPFVPAGRGHDS